ncbi:hypothetical protein OIO90_004246 [Microbotryomycetes sp. JL221]|nr:hypothetical protein OIO90_004246 [Microbotryomycetes sp. JL221]
MPPSQTWQSLSRDRQQRHQGLELASASVPPPALAPERDSVTKEGTNGSANAVAITQGSTSDIRGGTSVASEGSSIANALLMASEASKTDSTAGIDTVTPRNKGKQHANNSVQDQATLLDQSGPEPNAFDPSSTSGSRSSVTASTGTTHDTLFSAWPIDKLTIETRNKKKGRGVYAKRRIEPGPLFDTQPIVAVLSSTSIDDHCHFCFRTRQEIFDELQAQVLQQSHQQNGASTHEALMNMMQIDSISTKSSLEPFDKCSRCKIVRYCSVNCQKSDWTLHKLECQALQRVLSAARSADVTQQSRLQDLPTAVVRMIARLMWLKQSKTIRGEKVWSEFQQLSSDTKRFGETNSEVLVYISRQLAAYVGHDFLQICFAGAAEVMDVIAKVKTNAHGLTGLVMDDIGIALSPSAAMFNHSCLPNAAVVFPHSPASSVKHLRVMALRRIEPTEEISVAYIDNMWPRTKRQHALRRQYFFDCDCVHCQQMEEIDIRERIGCVERCGGFADVPLSKVWQPLVDDNKRENLAIERLVRAKCLNCQREWSINVDKVIQACDLAEHAIRNQREVFDKLPKQIHATFWSNFQRLQNLSKQALTPLPVSTYPLSTIVCLLTTQFETERDQDLLTGLSNLDQLIKPMQQTLGDNHPMIADKATLYFIANAQLGQLNSVQDFNNVYTSAARAVEACQGAFGKESHLRDKVVLALSKWFLSSVHSIPIDMMDRDAVEDVLRRGRLDEMVRFGREVARRHGVTLPEI